jgi:hypothetical protein
MVLYANDLSNPRFLLGSRPLRPLEVGSNPVFRSLLLDFLVVHSAVGCSLWQRIFAELFAFWREIDKRGLCRADQLDCKRKPNL